MPKATVPMTVQFDSIRETGSSARQSVIGLIAFLTVVDLFATQAVLPALVQVYGVSPAVIGTAVNASTIGMAVSGLVVGALSRHIDRQCGVAVALALLAVPTWLLASAPDLATFTALRIAQGVCMAAAFTLTLAYLAEATSGSATAAAFAAYVTGNVASNLVGRLMAASLTDVLGLATSFHVFAALNLAGAMVAYLALGGMRHMAVQMTVPKPAREILRRHFGSGALRATFAIGFCILFVFIGTFTYVNFVLVRPPLALSMASVGLVYLVFLPSIVTTPLTGSLVRILGTRTTLWVGLALAGAGLSQLLESDLTRVLIGLMLVGIGTFIAQATATGFVGRAGAYDSGSASGLYLAFYFLGGLVGSAVLGQVFVNFGWSATVQCLGLALLVAGLLTFRLRLEDATVSSAVAQ